MRKLNLTYSCSDPTETVRKRIIGAESSVDHVPLLKIIGDHGKEQLSLSPSRIPLPLPTASESDDMEILSDSEDESPPISSPKTIPFRQPKRWVPYSTSLFQWGVLPISQVYVPLSHLGPPPSGILSELGQNEGVSVAPTTLIGNSSTFTRERKQIWERILRGEPVVNNEASNVPWRDPTLWSSNFWHR